MKKKIGKFIGSLGYQKRVSWKKKSKQHVQKNS